VRGKLQKLWSHLSLAGGGAILATIPLVAVIISASLAFLGNRQRALTENAVVHHIELGEGLAQLSTLMLNAETGLRGFLLTRQPEFLQPYELAIESLPGELQRLHTLVESEPGEEPRREKRARLAAIRETVGEETAILSQLRSQVTEGSASAAPPNESLPQQLVRSNSAMEKLRAQLRGMRGEEQTLLAARLSDIERVRRRDYLVIAAALLLGLGTRAVAIYLFNRRVAARVEAVTDELRLRTDRS
jgi:CHASE3 domain sensor protein